MNANSKNRNTSADGTALRWNGRVVTAEDLRQSLNGQRELVLSPQAVITPLAADHLRANGVRVVRQAEAFKSEPQGPGLGTPTWGYSQERSDPLVGSVIQSLKGDGVNLKELPIKPQLAPGADKANEITAACGLARAVAECVIRHDCQGAVVFCEDPGLVCCLANKIKGIRAVPAISDPRSSRAGQSLGVNFLAIAINGKTFYELRLVLRTLCQAETACSGPLAKVLEELETPCQCSNPGRNSAPSKGECHCGGGHAHR